MEKELRQLLAQFKIFPEQRWGGWYVTLAPLSSQEVQQDKISKAECDELADKLNTIKGE